MVNIFLAPGPAHIYQKFTNFMICKGFSGTVILYQTSLMRYP